MDTKNYEITCWGCGLRLLLPSNASVFNCGWCGAITNQNKQKCDKERFRWRLLRDRCIVSIVLVFMLFLICKPLLFLVPAPFWLLFVVFQSNRTYIFSPVFTFFSPPDNLCNQRSVWRLSFY